MNAARSDFDRALREWFADGPTTMPDRAIDAVADRIDRQPQRRSWRLPGRPLMNIHAKVGFAAAALIVVAIAGYSLLPRTAPGPGGIPSPSPTSVPTGSPATAPGASTAPSEAVSCEDGTACSGRLQAGAHAAQLFEPVVTFTTPPGWVNLIDLDNLYKLDSETTDDYLLVIADVAISDHATTCEPVKLPGVGNTVADWIGFVTTHPALVAGAPVAVDLGDAHGQVLNLSIRTGWTKTCDGFPGASLQFIMQTADAHIGTYGAASWNWLRLYVLDVGGETVLITQYGLGPEITEIVESMDFTAAVG